MTNEITDDTIAKIEEITTTTTTQLKRLAGIIGGNAWGVDRSMPRIYMRSGSRDRKFYFDFPDWPTGESAEILGGERFQVRINECGQAPAWYASQRKIAIKSYTRHALAISAAQADAWELAEMIMNRDEEYSDGEIDEAAGHLLNGRIDEARTCLDLEDAAL